MRSRSLASGIPRPTSTARAMDAFRALCGPGRPRLPDQQTSDSTSDAVTHCTCGPSCAVCRAQLFVRAVGQGQRDPRFGAQRELVGVVALDRPVPVEVVGRQRGHGDHPGRREEVGDLEARGLDHPVVRLRPGRGVPRRVPDVPAGPGPVAETAEQVHGERGRRALALGPRDARDPGRVGVRHVEAEASVHGDPGGLESDDLGAVAADPRALDDDVAAKQRVETARPGGQYVEPVEGGRGGPVVHEHGHAAHGREAPDTGPALDAEPPDADGRVSERGPGGRRVHTGPGCGGGRAARTGPRRPPLRRGSRHRPTRR